MGENLEGKTFDWKNEIKENKYISPIQKKVMERLHDPSYQSFHLDKSFVNKYSKQKAPFGFNGFGELVYMRTYSRIKEDGFNEQWHDTVERVVNGTYNMQKRWIQDNGLEWSDYRAQKSAQEMYDRMFHMKFLPPGRGIWAMGSEVTEERGLYAALNNCAFVSTENLKEDLSKPFKFLMDMSMLGVGVGFDTRGAGQVIVKGPDYRRIPEKFLIPDSREGWVESVGRLIDSYLLGIAPVKFDYSQIRDRGKHINGFGGKSSGPEPLKELHTNLTKVLGSDIGKPLNSRSIVDMQNMIGMCVVAGNVRRTAEIALGDYDDETFLDLKNYSLNPERAKYGWTSNNSIFGELGMDYTEVAKRIANNGEPGIIWLDNIRKYGRMIDAPNNKDIKTKGVNPCVEQSLESYELCNLVETFPMNNKNLDDYLRTLKFAYLYAKTVTLGQTHWPDTNRVLLRNRRIGNSISGIQQYIAENGLDEFKTLLDKGYNEIQKWDELYSNWLTVPRSIKTTSIKPSGTVSSVAGATPGMHWPISEYYIRRMRLSKQSELINPLREAGIPISDDKNDKSSFVVEFPVHIGKGIRSEEEVSMMEQFEMVSFIQKYWADNQVSATIKFNPDLRASEIEELNKLNSKKDKSQSDLEKIIYLTNKQAKSETNQIQHALDYFQYNLKGISLLPKDEKIYEQAPFEAINREEYLERTKNLKDINFSMIKNLKALGESGCTNDACEEKADKLLIEENFNKFGNHLEGPALGSTVLYTTANCPSCAETKKFLNERKIPWQEVNVKEDEGRKRFNEFYRQNKSTIERKDGTIAFPILSNDSGVVQGLEKIIKSLNQDA